MKLNPQITGNVGLYYCCYRLSLLGWNVMPTARNARGVDLIVYDATGRNFKGIQVKALSKRDPVPLGPNIDQLMGDWWIIVNNLARDPAAFVMTPGEVQAGAHRGIKVGKVSFWLQRAQYDIASYRDAWARIGGGDQSPAP